MKPKQFREANGTLLGGPAAQYGTDKDVEDLPVYRGAGETISCWSASLWERLRILITGKVYLRIAAQTHPPVSVEGFAVFPSPRWREILLDGLGISGTQAR